MGKVTGVKHPPKQRPKAKLTPIMEKNKWKKGQSGNPNGRPTLTPEQRALKNLNIQTHAAVIRAVLGGSMAELNAMEKDPNTPAITLLLVGTIKDAIRNKNYAAVEKIIERIVGKVPDVMEINSTSNNLNIQLTDDTLKSRLAKIRSDV